MGDRLVELGFREGSPNVHPGQGTRNRRFFFDNAMLELIWVENPDEAGSSLIAPTRLWERSRASETGASPFGLCLRQTRADEPLPFATWPYQPPYLPPLPVQDSSLPSMRRGIPLLPQAPALTAACAPTWGEACSTP